jgi:hypothetical protein
MNEEDLPKQTYFPENDKFTSRFVQDINRVLESADLLLPPDRCGQVFHTARRYFDKPDISRFIKDFYFSSNLEEYAQNAGRKRLDVLAKKPLPLFETVADAEHRADCLAEFPCASAGGRRAGLQY